VASERTLDIDYERLGKVIAADVAALLVSARTPATAEQDSTTNLDEEVAVDASVAGDVAALMAELTEAVNEADEATARSLMEEIGRI